MGVNLTHLGWPGIVEFYSMYEYNLFTTNIAKAAFLSMNVFISGSGVY
jgi:hypothetical protein